MNENNKTFLRDAYRRLCCEKMSLCQENQKCDKIVNQLNQCNANLNSALDLYIQELERENPIVFVIKSYSNLPTTIEMNSICRTKQQADLLIQELEDKDDIHAFCENEPIHLIDVIPRKKLLADMVIREMESLFYA